jgi:hypothetical protein
MDKLTLRVQTIPEKDLIEVHVQDDGVFSIIHMCMHEMHREDRQWCSR